MANSRESDNRADGRYQDLTIEFDPTEVSWTDGSGQNVSDIEKRVVIRNGGLAISECRVVLEEVAYLFRDEWIDPPNGYQKQALRWAEKTDTRVEQIEIPANQSAKLIIARLYRYPNPFFGIAYSDGSYGKTHHFMGSYRLRLKMEAKISGRQPGLFFLPVIYEIHLNYLSALDLEIDDIVRISPE